MALQAFIQKHGTSEIVLMIDEAENRLHYDAQADLVYMLTKQSSATSVIYTTHSAGCLPQDLGRGVKLVEVDKNQETRSKIVNKFWSQNQKGLTPLLIGMEAATIAFFPTRKAVMVEGASDLLLLPRLLREATGSRMFEFQLIPGLSSQGPALAHIAIQSEKHILYLVDSDAGGDQLTNLLKSAKIPENRIFRVGYSRNVSEPEDYIEANALIEAANNVVAKMRPGSALLKLTDLQSENRMESLEAAFKRSTGQKLLKVDLAYELLSLIDVNPERNLSDARRRPGLTKIWEALNRAFSEAAVPQS